MSAGKRGVSEREEAKWGACGQSVWFFGVGVYQLIRAAAAYRGGRERLPGISTVCIAPQTTPTTLWQIPQCQYALYFVRDNVNSGATFRDKIWTNSFLRASMFPVCLTKNVHDRITENWAKTQKKWGAKSPSPCKHINQTQSWQGVLPGLWPGVEQPKTSDSRWR